jgi:protein N-terminal amidase
LGITFAWARFIALKYECVVSVGFPEKMSMSELAFSKCYNSSVTVDADGEVIANYRKSFLDDSDKIWALEGLDGFLLRKYKA